eukprot:149936-Pelagomonas_calceolata.AAC.9
MVKPVHKAVSGSMGGVYYAFTQNSWGQPLGAPCEVPLSKVELLEQGKQAHAIIVLNRALSRDPWFKLLQTFTEPQERAHPLLGSQTWHSIPGSMLNKPLKVRLWANGNSCLVSMFAPFLPA